MKTLPLLSLSLSVLALVGCAQTAPGTSRAGDQTVLATTPMAYGTGAAYGGAVTQPLVVSGEMETSRVPVAGNTVPRHDLVVRVNGQPAITGSLVTYGNTLLEGRYGATEVVANCSSRELGRADRQFDCRISLNAQPATVLSFRATPFGPAAPLPPA
ncbi:hypothetical protein [Roseomonas fluvialis]|uniref:Lipoprotein n=1 Tax=Roseomonas fluvialis TaxID=1750527 RepID=A0ABM7Y5H8_9PROT|nr:hypothetical protein [Roseomonas fluvialis]BDG73158.1 hypothetical protein Rmf_30870 [Roseomonas fluvialis]